jgi:hypothetical protein
MAWVAWVKVTLKTEGLGFVADRACNQQAEEIAQTN